jgi:hypothetical protein
MTASEWSASPEPGTMLEALRGKISSRKARLFACACCRQIAGGVFYSGFLEAAERHADGAVDDDGLAAACAVTRAIAEAPAGLPAWDGTGAMEYLDWVGANAAVPACAPAAGVSEATEAARWAAGVLGGEPVEAAQAAQSDLLRDMIGNPYRVTELDRRWLTSDAVALAAGIYADQAFDRLPVLADALMDAGCDSEDILAHCRSDGPHVRGCWVVDLVLGKE